MTGVATSSWTSWRKLGGLAGMVFGIGGLLLLLIIGAGAPTRSDSMSDIREYFTDDATTWLVVNWVIALLFTFVFLVFASALRNVLAGADRDGGFWARLSFAAALVSVAVAGAGSIFWAALSLEGADNYSNEVVQALMDLDAITFSTVLPWGFALFLASAAVVILRSGVLWKWLAWVGLVSAAMMVVGALWLVDGDDEGVLAIIGFIGIGVTFLWIATAGYQLVRTD